MTVNRIKEFLPPEPEDSSEWLEIFLDRTWEWMGPGSTLPTRVYTFVALDHDYVLSFRHEILEGEFDLTGEFETREIMEGLVSFLHVHAELLAAIGKAHTIQAEKYAEDNPWETI